MTEPEGAAAVLEYFKAHHCLPGGIEDCVICHGQPAYVGFWCATEECSKRLVAPEGKVRMIAYLLCSEHYELPKDEMCRQVEAVILSDLAQLKDADSHGTVQ